MTKDRLWEIYVSRRPSFLTDGATLTPNGLRKFFDTTWDSAFQEGLVNGKALRADERHGDFEDTLMEKLGIRNGTRGGGG